MAVIDDIACIYNIATISKNKLRCARLDNGQHLLVCIACGAYAGVSPRQLMDLCAGRHSSPGLSRQRARIISGLHPHSSHGAGARIASLVFPSSTQVAWLWDEIKPTPSRRAARPACDLGLAETFARYGLCKHDDRLQWAQRARAKKLVIEGSDEEE